MVGPGYAYMPEEERKKYAAQMDEIIRLMREMLKLQQASAQARTPARKKNKAR